jgi:tagatose-1,6-bisphosphate aldolase
MSYSLGKFRRLQHCATPGGKLIIMAVDHRDNLRGYLQAAHPDKTIGYDEMVSFKLDVTAALQDTYSAALLDPEFGVAQAIVDHVLPGQAGVIVSVEKWGYSGDELARETAVLPDWGVDKISRVGGDGVKMLLYYHPDAPNAAAQEAVVRQVVAACTQHDIPFFLEPIVYSIDPDKPVLSSAEKRSLVVQAARTFSRMGIDVLKAEFPLQIDDELDEAVWAEACTELTEACQTPWVLLSAGVDFDTFARMTQVACINGCSGVMVGRAVWKEAIPLAGEARTQFLHDTAVSRMRQLADICEQYGRSWVEAAPIRPKIKENWYKTY